MSTPLNKAIYARLTNTETPPLTGDAAAAAVALAALLGVDPDVARPAVFMGNKALATVYPCITFRPNGGSSDERVVGGIAVGSAVIALEIWENGGSALTIGDIFEQVERLLDRRRQIAPALPLTAGRCLWFEAQSELNTLYDEQRGAWCGLVLYRAIEGRY